MRWFRLGPGRQQVQQDPDRQAALLHDIRQRFGPHVQVRFTDQAREVAHALNGDDGLFAAATVLRDFADAAASDMHSQAAANYQRTGRGFAVDRRNYRPAWKAAGPELRWPLFALPCGFHPYVHVAGAVLVVGANAKRITKVMDPDPLLVHLFEVLDLTVAGWEFGNVRVDADIAGLALALVSTTRDLRAAMDEPPPLPPAVRELMRRNNTITVLDLSGHGVAAFNPGKEMREALLA
ncbi:hypothetical protein [Actinoplanes friuliensis]|uniref:Uncharacterized protein n=1 Tax=Actinoplanes friuliensis DSM 7358 TaxID=1246995 RepID=U5W1D0_9ACTN|nr:hypothetical protein [Actinoplanes friuliensis]AGZ43038.1 hypothetical protein AFR_23850 [Actinoplanes friuliensis DSM 7358]